MFASGINILDRDNRSPRFIKYFSLLQSGTLAIICALLSVLNSLYKMSDTATHEAEIAAKAASPVKKVVNAEPAKDGDAAKPENGEKSSPVKNGES